MIRLGRFVWLARKVKLWLFTGKRYDNISIKSKSHKQESITLKVGWIFTFLFYNKVYLIEWLESSRNGKTIFISIF